MGNGQCWGPRAAHESPKMSMFNIGLGGGQGGEVGWGDLMYIVYGGRGRREGWRATMAPLCLGDKSMKTLQ